MKRFIYKCLAYLGSLILILFLLLTCSSYFVKKRGFLNYQTEGNLPVFKTYTDYDILIMGISHARNFSRHTNHIKLEKNLNKSIINIGQGSGICGVNEQLFYLDYFYHLKNKTHTLIYVLSPPMFFSEELPLASNTFMYETFELPFLYRYLFFKTENKKERISSYLQSVLTKQWFSSYPYSEEDKPEKLDSINWTEVERGQIDAMGTHLSLERFNKSANTVKATINLALENGTEVILIIPPALFGKWRGHSEVVAFAKEISNSKRVKFYDCSESVLDPKYYYDHHHLNTNGVVYFTENYLKPIINSN